MRLKCVLNNTKIRNADEENDSIFILLVNSQNN